MSEKDGITSRRVTFTGIFDFNAFYELLGSVLSGLKYDMSPVEEKAAKGDTTEHEIFWEADRNIDFYTKFYMEIKFQTFYLKKVSIKEGGRTVERDSGKIQVSIKPFLITDYGDKWEETPYLKFLKSFFDKYLYGRTGSLSQARGKYKLMLIGLSNDVDFLVNEIKAFFNLTKT